MNKNEVYRRILEIVSPDANYNKALDLFKSEIFRKFKSAFSDELRYKGLVLIGSSATGTALIWKKDLDGIVIFGNYDKEAFRNGIVKVGLDEFRFKDVSQIEDKVDGRLGDYEVNIGCVDVKHRSDENIGADMVRHPEFSSRLSQSQKNDVRLAKIFFRNINLDGGKIGGFAIEQIIAFFQTFDGFLLKLASGSPIKVDFSGKYKGEKTHLVVSYPFCGMDNLARLNEKDTNESIVYANSILGEPRRLLEDTIKIAAQYGRRY